MGNYFSTPKSSSEETDVEPIREVVNPEDNLPSQEMAVEAPLQEDSPQPQQAARHVKISELVNSVILRQKKYKGSTLNEIHDEIVKKSLMDARALRKSIREYLKRAVEKGMLLVTGGEGSTRTYKLAPSTLKEMKQKQRTATRRVKAPAVGPGKAKTTQKATGTKRTGKTGTKRTEKTATKRAAHSVNVNPPKRMKSQMNGGGVVGSASNSSG